MNEEVKTCVSCRWFEKAENVYNPHVSQVERPPRCTNTAAATRDLIYGTALCQLERDSRKGCGKQGKLWEALTNKEKNA